MQVLWCESLLHDSSSSLKVESDSFATRQSFFVNTINLIHEVSQAKHSFQQVAAIMRFYKR